MCSKHSSSKHLFNLTDSQDEGPTGGCPVVVTHATDCCPEEECPGLLAFASVFQRPLGLGWPYSVSLVAVYIEVCCFAQLHCCCSVTKWCQTVCDPMDCSTPCVPVFHHPLTFAQTHVHRVSDAIQPSCLPFPSPSAFSLYQLQGLLFKSGGQSIGASASILPVNIQDWFPIELTGLISLLSKELSRVCSSTTVWKHQLHKNTFFTDTPLSKCSQGSLSVS